jgi:flagellar hook assembly protein FlgD
VGQKVATLASGVRPAGYHTVRWDGRSDAGQKVSGGVYFYRLTTPEYTGTKRLVMLR